MKTTPGENRSGEIFAVVAFFLVLAATGLGLRFESKRIIRKSLLLDDYLVIVAFVSSADIIIRGTRPDQCYS